MCAKNYLISILLLFACIVAAQTPVQKKIHTINFAGIEAGGDLSYYNYGDGFSPLYVNPYSFKGYLPDNSLLFSSFNNTDYLQSFIYNNLYSEQKWQQNSSGISVIGLFALGNKDKTAINNNDILRAGLGYYWRDLNSATFDNILFEQTDTVGFTVFGNDTVYKVSDTTAIRSAYLATSTQTVSLHLGYMHRLNPTDKLNLSLGLGIDVCMGNVVIAGGITDYHERAFKSMLSADSTGNGWTYINYYPNEGSRSATEVETINIKRFKAFTARPYVALRTEYRLGKTGFLQHLNLFAEGRYGWEVSNTDKLTFDAKKRFMGLRFGITYNFSNLPGS